MRRFLPAVALTISAALTAAVGRPGRAQNVEVTPNPAPLDGAFTIHASGIQPGGPVELYWDRDQVAFTVPNIFLNSNPTADANGNLNFTVDLIPFRIYPATAGPHTLTVTFFAPFGSPLPIDPTTLQATVRVPVTLLPRTGWAPSPRLPAAASPRLSGGLLAYLNYLPDHSAAAIALSDGGPPRIWTTLSVPGAIVSQPAWSPDGSRIAFSASLDTTPDSNEYVLGHAGRVEQATSIGGGPPKLTGGGKGSVSGSVLPFVGTPPPSPPDEDTCGDKLTADPPKGVFATLVGTGLTVSAPLPPGARDGDPIPFHIDDVPEGNYSLHLWYTTLLCQESTKPNPLSSQQGQKATLVVHQRAGATVNLTLPVHVAAGQPTQLPAVQPVATYQFTGPPTWLDGGTLVYELASGVWDRGGGPATADLWSVPVGGIPAQLTDSTRPTQGPASAPAASPATRRIAGVPDALGGIFVADAANVPGTVKTVTSPFAILAAYQLSIIDANPSWAPDAAHLAFIRRNFLVGTIIADIDPVAQANSLTGGIRGDLWIKDVVTGKEGGLTGLKIAGGEGLFGRPAWSPDGSQVAVSYTPDNFKTVNIRVYNVADGSSFDLTNDGRSALPTWTGVAQAAYFPAGAVVFPQNPIGPAANVGPPGVPPMGTLPGDLNGDGKVTVQDATIALQIVVHSIVPTAAQKQAADIDGNGTVDIRDVTAILRKVVGL